MNRLLLGLRNPSLVYKAVFNRVQHALAVPFRFYLHQQTGPFVNALTEDWDNLVVLDACRYDTFADLSSLPGELERRYSVGSATREWLIRAVGDRDFHDIVYVTANPRVTRYEEQFHEVVPVWKTHWDETLKVAPPDDVTEQALAAHREYPNKRIVVHYMQPHVPFIGDFGRSNVGIHDGTTKGTSVAAGEQVQDRDFVEPFDLLQAGRLDGANVRKAYRENLELVLPEVERLLAELPGKSVVTADHGEMFGKVGWPFPARVYGHENMIPARELLAVPWLEYQNGSRRDTTVEDPTRTDDDVDEDEIERRLRELGYR